MDFSNIARQLNEGGTEATDTAIASSEKAKEGGEKQVNNTIRRRDSQKAHMSQQQNTPVKSDVSYTSEEHRAEREYAKMMEAAKVDWRQELM